MPRYLHVSAHVWKTPDPLDPLGTLGLPLIDHVESPGTTYRPNWIPSMGRLRKHEVSEPRPLE